MKEIQQMLPCKSHEASARSGSALLVSGAGMVIAVESFGFVVAQVPEACVGFLFSHLGFPKGDTRC